MIGRRKKFNFSKNEEDIKSKVDVMELFIFRLVKKLPSNVSSLVHLFLKNHSSMARAFAF